MVLSIILIICLILVILLLIPIKLILKYENSVLNIHCSYAFFKFNKKNEKKEKQKIQSTNKLKKSKKTEDILKQIPKYINLLKIIFPIIILLFKKIKLKKINLFARISSSDAKNCALSYSYMYSICKSIINFFDLKNKVKDLKIKLIPDFSSSESLYSGEVVLSLSLLDIFSVLIYGVLIFIKNVKNLRE